MISSCFEMKSVRLQHIDCMTDDVLTHVKKSDLLSFCSSNKRNRFQKKKLITWRLFASIDLSVVVLRFLLVNPSVITLGWLLTSSPLARCCYIEPQKKAQYHKKHEFIATPWELGMTRYMYVFCGKSLCIVHSWIYLSNWKWIQYWCSSHWVVRIF